MEGKTALHGFGNDDVKKFSESEEISPLAKPEGKKPARRSFAVKQKLTHIEVSLTLLIATWFRKIVSKT